MKTQVINARLSIDEKETHYYISAAEDDVVYMDTTILKDYNKALKQGWKLVCQYVAKDGSIVGGKLTAPRRCLSLRNVKAKELSEKQKMNLIKDE